MTLKTKTEHCFYLIRQLALISENNAANGSFHDTTVRMVMFTCVCLDFALHNALRLVLFYVCFHINVQAVGI